jgi:hypothetical protein
MLIARFAKNGAAMGDHNGVNDDLEYLTKRYLPAGNMCAPCKTSSPIMETSKQDQ